MSETISQIESPGRSVARYRSHSPVPRDFDAYCGAEQRQPFDPKLRDRIDAERIDVNLPAAAIDLEPEEDPRQQEDGARGPGLRAVAQA